MVDFITPEQAKRAVRREAVVFAEVMGKGPQGASLEVHVMRPTAAGPFEFERDDTGPLPDESVEKLVARIAAAHGSRYATIYPAEQGWPPAWTAESTTKKGSDMARKGKKKAGAPKQGKGRLDAEMKQLDRRLDALKASARNAEAGLKAQTQRQMAALRKKQAQAKLAIAKLGRQSAAAGGPLKTGLRKAWRDIEGAVRQATKRFRETT